MAQSSSGDFVFSDHGYKFTVSRVVPTARAITAEEELGSVCLSFVCLPAHLFPRSSLKPNVRAVRCAFEDLWWQVMEITKREDSGRIMYGIGVRNGRAPSRLQIGTVSQREDNSNCT